MRVHVTGATGFLGRALMRARPGATSTRVEIRDAFAVGRLMTWLRPEAVIHTAYRQDGPEARAVIVDGSANVAAAAAAAGARLIHVSTDVVFGGGGGAPYAEDAVPDPLTAYGTAKRDAELAVLERHPAALVVRTSLILGGPGADPSRYELGAADAAATFFDDELRSPVLAADLAAALLELAASDATGVLHLGGPDDMSRADLAEAIAGRPVRRAPAPDDRPRDCRLDSRLSRSLLRTRVRGPREVFAPARPGGA